MTKDQWEHAKSLYLAGMEWKAIATELNVSQATLSTKASREGITKVKAQMQTICTEKKTQSLEALSAIVRSKLAEDAAATLERVNGYDLDGIKDEATREQVLGSVAKRSALVFGWSEQGEAASVSINLLGQMPDRTPVEVVVSEPSDK
jgi:orotate phosphoribosyltransferase-like protein